MSNLKNAYYLRELITSGPSDKITDSTVSEFQFEVQA